MLYALYFWGIPQLFNVEKNINKYEAFILNATGYNLKISNPKLKMGLIPGIWIMADRIELLNKDNSKALDLVAPKIKISVFRFLVGKCNINHFYADTIKANIIYTNDSKLYLGDYYLPKSSNSQLDLNNLKLNIQDFNININDEQIKQNSIIVGDYFVIKKFLINKQYIISSAFEIRASGNKSNVNFDLNLKMPLMKNLSANDSYLNASITNFDLSCLSKYISYITNAEYKDLKGILNFEAHSQDIEKKNNFYNINLVLENFGINGKDFAQPYFYNGRVSLCSSYTAKQKDLVINSLNFSTDNLSVDLYGEIKKISSSSPVLALNLKTKNSRAEKLVELLPANNKFYKELEFDIETLVKSKFFANVDMDLTINGNYLKPDVYGDLNITEAYVTNNPIPNGAKKADINLKFKKDRILMDVLVPAAVNEYVTVGGFVELYDKKNVEIIVKSSKNVDLGIAQYVLMPVHKVLNFDLGPVPVMDIDGFGNIDLVVKGNKFDPHAFGVFNFERGVVSFNDIHNLVMTNASGNLKFDDRNTIFTTKSAKLNGEPITVDGTCTLFGVLDFSVKSKNQPANLLVNVIKSSPMLDDIGEKIKTFNIDSGLIDVDLKLTGKIIDPYSIIFGKNLFANGSITLSKIFGNLSDINIPISNINGIINFDNFNLVIKVESAINNSKLKIVGKINENLANLNISSDNLQLDDIVSFISKKKIVPFKKNKKNIISFFANYNGPIDNLDYSKLRVECKTNLSNYKFLYKPTNANIEILNGGFNIQNSVLNLNKTNIKIENMPLFIYGRISNLYNNPTLNINVASRPNQAFADILFNENAIYPVKLRGNISHNMKITGTLNDLNLNSLIKIGENSKIYYMGASFGDDINQIFINLDANIKNKNIININKLSEDKLLKTNTKNTIFHRILDITGTIKIYDKDVIFDNLKIRTLSENDARLFNIIFRKPFIKQGTFNSDIQLSGSIKRPKIIGKASAKNISIPKYFLNINKATILFMPNVVRIVSNGNFVGEYFNLNSTVDNKFYEPYIINDVKLDIKNLNLNTLVSNLNEMELDINDKLSNTSAINFNIPKFIIKNANIKSDIVIIDKLILNNLTANGNFDSEKKFNLSHFKFLAANGEINGKYSLNSKTLQNEFSIIIDDVDANEFTEKSFNLRNQITGKINGEMNISCLGITQQDCLKSISGHGGFKISKGKMPKLGSLEYLLNAANLVKSGITGLSLNGLIDLITPLRTGEFESIVGTLDLKNGKINNIQIYSQGKNLNLFLSGQIDLSTSIANMKIFGRLLRNTTNILGPIGNASLNALFNTIPGINLSKNSDNTILESINKIPGVELTSSKYRIFTVDINGDINGNDYVRSFKWVE